jgi:O-Antigen ligase
MGTVGALALYALLLAAAAAAIWRRPVVALYLFVVGLALHNAVMAALYGAGLRGSALTAVTAWKEILLVVALARAGVDAVRERRLPFDFALVDALALAFAALVVVYALIPQAALGGAAGRHAVLLGARHDLVPVGAYFLGRSLRLGPGELRRLAWTLLGTAAAVAAIGLVDVYAVSIGWWRSSAVVDYFRKHLGYDYHGTGGLPENFVYNTGSEDHFLRRLVSTFLSPLGSGYLFVVALLVAAAALRRRTAIALGVVAAAGLLWTFSRSSLIALAAGFVVLGVARRQTWPLAAAVATIGIAVTWAHVFPSIGPTGKWTQADLAYQRQHAQQHPGASGSATSDKEPSIHSHLTSLRDGFRTMTDHPQGYGLGNVGQTASRTNTKILAGESNYTELGVELGVLGAVLWTAWGLGLLRGLVRCRAVAAAAVFGAILVLAIQTDVIGDPWVAYCVWALGGLQLRPALRRASQAAPGRRFASSPSARAEPGRPG